MFFCVIFCSVKHTKIINTNIYIYIYIYIYLKDTKYVRRTFGEGGEAFKIMQKNIFYLMKWGSKALNTSFPPIA